MILLLIRDFEKVEIYVVIGLSIGNDGRFRFVHLINSLIRLLILPLQGIDPALQKFYLDEDGKKWRITFS